MSDVMVTEIGPVPATLCDALALWNQVEPMMALAVATHGNPTVPDGHLEFHRQSLIGMVLGGYHTFRYIQVGDGVLPIARSQGEDEHWYTIGGLMNCSFEPPCTPEQLRRALRHVPALGDLHIYPAKLSACELLEYPDHSGVLAVPPSLAQFVADAPKKVRGEWGRLMRKAEAAQIIFRRQPAAICMNVARKLLPGYSEYWKGRHDSYTDESSIVVSTVDTFEAMPLDQWFGLVGYQLVGETLVPIAVNLAWLKRDTVYDTICVRDMREELKPYSLGILAILYNLELARQLGAKHYSMALGDQPYKKQFCYADAKPAKYLSVISDIDVLFGQYPGYHNGHWVTEDHPVELGQPRIEQLNQLYPFTLDKQEEE